MSQLKQMIISLQPSLMNSKQLAKENIEPLDLQETKVSTKINDEQSKQIAILFQYKMLQMYGSLLGIYAIPNLQNYKIWNCIIFVRKGFYKDGKFKFDVTFPFDFPQKAPTIKFKSQLYHSLVRESDGMVDINELLGEQWNYQNENMLYSLFSNLQRMFNEKAKIQIRHSYNPQAAKLLATKPHLFIQKALQSVELAKDKLYSNQAGTSMVIKKYEKGQLDRYKQKLQTLCEQNRAPEQKRKQFLHFVMNQNE